MTPVSNIRSAPFAPVTAPVRTFAVDQAEVAVFSAHMEEEVLGTGLYAGVGHGDIPAIDLVPAQGTSCVTPLQNHFNNNDGLDYEGPAGYKITAMPKDKTFDFTLLVPVSGHCGAANAKAWAGLDPARIAETNTFNVRITLPDGSKQTLSNLEVDGYVTGVNLSVPLSAGKITVEYWPDGSGGVGGYPEGRTLEIFIPKGI